MKLTTNDLKLIEYATEVLQANLDLNADKDTIVSCALSTKSGKIYKGVNIATSHSVCAEQVAIGQAFANCERDLDTIVAVKLDDDGVTPKVTSPCGLCRYIMNKRELDIFVIVEDIKTGKVLKVKASELLPYPYQR